MPKTTCWPGRRGRRALRALRVPPFQKLLHVLLLLLTPQPPLLFATLILMVPAADSTGQHIIRGRRQRRGSDAYCCVLAKGSSVSDIGVCLVLMPERGCRLGPSSFSPKVYRFAHVRFVDTIAATGTTTLAGVDWSPCCSNSRLGFGGSVEFLTHR